MQLVANGLRSWADDDSTALVQGGFPASCTQGERWGSGGFALQSAATNSMVRDLDLPVNATDSGRFEVVVDGLRFGRSQLHDIVVFPSQRRFTSQWGCGHRRCDLPGQAAQRGDAQLVGPASRARLIVGFGRGVADSSLVGEGENCVSCRLGG